MPGPQDPDSPSEPPHDPATDRAAEDAMWASIVEHYGERAVLDDEPAARAQADPGDPHDAADPVIEVPGSTRDLFRELRPEPAYDVDDVDDVDDSAHFVPPPPPPVPRTTPARTIAWAGLFGVPLVVLVAVVAGLEISSWLGLILMVWFVGGFVFLVASMRPGPRDEDEDDGAVV